MIGRGLQHRSGAFASPAAAPRFEPASLHGLGGGFVPAGLGSAQIGTVSCPNCGTAVRAPEAAPPQASAVAYGAALAGSVVSMTAAGLLTHLVSKRVLGW